MGSVQILIQTSDGPNPDVQAAELDGVTVTGSDAPGGQRKIAVGASPGQGSGYYASVAPALVSGESPAPISVPVITGNSVFIFTLRNPAGSTALGKPKQANVVPGTPGTFEIISLKDDTTTETGDDSVYQWMIVEPTQ